MTTKQNALRDVIAAERREPAAVLAGLTKPVQSLEFAALVGALACMAARATGSVD